MYAFVAFLVLTSSISFYQHEERSFLSWMRLNNQIYVGDEYHFRFGIFITNLRFIKEQNSINRSFKVGINRFAAYTTTEYHQLFNLQLKKPIKSFTGKPSKSKPDKSVDWRDAGIIPPVRDEMLPNMLISAVEAAQTVYAASCGALTTFSVRNLIDCSNGGSVEDIYNYVKEFQNGYFCTESSYCSYDGTCKFNECSKIGRLTSFVGAQSEDDFAKRIETNGPALIFIDPSNWSFQLYSGGICNDLNAGDHPLLVVGFGTENDVAYWIAKNNWGISWGERGYIRIAWGNVCSTAVIPIME